MSNPQVLGYDRAKAIKWNRKYHKRLAWYGRLPKKVTDSYLALGFDPSIGVEVLGRIADDTYAYQCDHSFDLDERDGKLGRGTYGHMWEKYAPASGVRDLIVNGVPVVCPDLKGERKSRLIDYRDPGGIDGRDMGFGSSSKRKRIRHGELHWGSTSPLKVAKILASKGTSTHFAVELGVAYQLMDLWRIGWHGAAKWKDEKGRAMPGALGNAESVGLDITQQPDVKWLKHFVDRGFDVEVMDNPARWIDKGKTKTRGRSQCISLEPRTIVTVAETMVDVSNVLGFPCRVPRGNDGMADEGPLFHGIIPTSVQPSFTGWCCHNNISRSKRDIACWLHAIAAELFEGDTNTLREHYRLA